MTPRPSARSDEGLSLIELIVAMGVLSIVLIIVSNLFVTVSATTRAANTARSAVGQASNAMDELSRVIRMGSPNAVAGSPTSDPAVVAGTATSLTVLAYVDTSATTPVPTQVAFAVTSGALAETRTASAASGSFSVFTGAVTNRTVASGLTSVAFAYAASDGTPITPDPVSGLSLAQRTAVASVTVTVTAPNGTDPIVLTNTVLLTNVALNNGSGS